MPVDRTHHRTDVKCVSASFKHWKRAGSSSAGAWVGEAYRLSARYPLHAELEALFEKTRDYRYYPRQDGPREHVAFCTRTRN